MNIFREAFLVFNNISYRRIARPLIFLSSAQASHDNVRRLLRLCDYPVLSDVAGLVHRASFEVHPVEVGGVQLPHPFMLAAGMVKGEGFASEDEAFAAVQSGRNIIPGWRSVPRLVGAVEFGSFTRWPRPGNPGVVMWRDVASQSTQNRVGLKNPGARAAAEFLAQHREHLPPCFGINIAVSPGVTDLIQEHIEATEALAAFLEKGVLPQWFTLNLSCPNTEDDPRGHQTEKRTRNLCRTLVEQLRPHNLPLWVKISPDLAPEQYAILMRVFQETGVRAVIATNTLAQPTPDDASLTAGIGGGRLRSHALRAVDYLMANQQPDVDIIGCGGVMDGATWRDYTGRGVRAVQYWSALVYRGPLAAALIEREGKNTSEFVRNRARAAAN